MNLAALSDEAALARYVQAAAPLAGLTLDSARLAAVTAQMARIATLAALLENVPLGPADEPAALFRP